MSTGDNDPGQQDLVSFLHVQSSQIRNQALIPNPNSCSESAHFFSLHYSIK